MDFQSRNLTVPRGKILFAPYKTGTQIPGAFKELGNCPEFTLTRNVSKLMHYGSQKGMKVKDEEIVTDSDLTGSVTTDDMRATNVALWMMSATSTVTQAAITSTTQNETVSKGDLIQLGRTALSPTGARNVTVTTVTSDPTGTTYVLGTDYIVHAELGMVEFLASGTIADNSPIIVTYTATTATVTRLTMGETDVEGELKFVAFNPVGANNDITIPRARISPNGDMSMLTDPESPAWQTLGLSITALKKDDLALAYRDGRPVA
ncbi:tail tube protein [Rhodobacter phage RcCWillis]|nr:tail tube protein [Rhodobacter phage RcCWillis]